MPDWINHRELRVIGMSRSGNHAVINWICAQATGRWWFLNCVEPQTNPFETSRPMGQDRRVLAADEPVDLEREARGDFTPKDWLIHSYEDCFLRMVCDGDKHHDDWVGPSRERFDVLILRDPFNLFASRIKSGLSGVTPKTTVRIWKQHARQFLGERRLLTQTPVLINFNRWASDRDFRRQIAQSLGLCFTDAGVNEVSSTAGGSSFDGTRYSGKAHRMRITDRWRKYRDDPEYLAMFDAEIIELSDAIFGRLESADFLIDKIDKLGHV